MLVVSRKCAEAISIGRHGEICVSVLEICGSHVRLGIDAPREVAILRTELSPRVAVETIPRPERTP